MDTRFITCVFSMAMAGTTSVLARGELTAGREEGTQRING
jgi:hypothetical protein